MHNLAWNFIKVFSSKSNECDWRFSNPSEQSSSQNYLSSDSLFMHFHYWRALSTAPNGNKHLRLGLGWCHQLWITPRADDMGEWLRGHSSSSRRWEGVNLLRIRNINLPHDNIRLSFMFGDSSNLFKSRNLKFIISKLFSIRIFFLREWSFLFTLFWLSTEIFHFIRPYMPKFSQIKVTYSYWWSIGGESFFVPLHNVTLTIPIWLLIFMWELIIEMYVILFVWFYSRVLYTANSILLLKYNKVGNNIHLNLTHLNLTHLSH